MPANAEADFSPDVAVRGSIRYPDPEQTARLVYARAVLSEQGGWDLLAYKSRDGRFPNHSVSQQMFTDEQFESYRALGYDAGVRALELLNIPQVLLQHESQPVDGTNNGRVNGQSSQTSESERRRSGNRPGHRTAARCVGSQHGSW